MRVRLHALTATMALAGLCSIATFSAHAAGFGSLRLQSEIGQPLRAEVDLRMGERESLSDVTIRPAATAEYERQAVPFSSELLGLRVLVQSRAGKPVAVLTTTAPIREPGLQFILKSESPQGSVLRSFSLPIVTSALSGASAAASMASSLALTSSAALSAPVFSNVSESDHANDATQIYANVIELGVRPSARSLGRVKGAGRADPVGKILKQVVPTNWKGFSGDAAIKNAPPLDWVGGGRFWIAILDEVMGKSGLNATVDWGRKEVTLRGLDIQPAALSMTQATTPGPSRTQPEVSAEQLARSARAEAAQAAAAVAASALEVRIQADRRIEEDRIASGVAAKARAQELEQAQANKRAEDAAEARAKADAQAQADAEQRVAEAAAQSKALADAAAAQLEAQTKARAAEQRAQQLQQEASEKLQAEQAALERAKHLRALAETRVKAQNERANAEEAALKAKADQAAQAIKSEKSQTAGNVSQAPAAELLQLTLVGDVLFELHQVNSAGADVSLLSAVADILPPNWSLFSQDVALNEIGKVTWLGGGREWLVVLNETLQAHGVRATLNAKRKEIGLHR